MWPKPKLLAAIVGLGAGVYGYKGFVGVVEALEIAPYPPKPYCVGAQCPVTAWDPNWDRLDSEQQSRDPNYSFVQKNIFLVRNGQYDTGGKKDEDRKLTQLGRNQMMMTAHRLAIMNFPYSYVMGSSTTRGKESYAIIGEHLDLNQGFNEFLNEGFPVSPKPAVPNLARDELYHQDVMKMEYAFRSLFKRPSVGSKANTYEILVCPANLIRYFICRALQFPPEGWLRWEIPHGSVTWITISKDGNVTIRDIGQVGHLPPKMITF